MRKVLGVFEGGGAKGIAHVGALRYAEEEGISWRAVAGTSAGAIIAALVASGYTSIEIYDPENPNAKNILQECCERNLLDLFGGLENWGSFRKFQKNVEAVQLRLEVDSGLALLANGPRLAFCLARLVWQNGKEIFRAKKRRGWFSTDTMIESFEKILQKKIVPSGDFVTFKDMPIDLHIISTDVATGSAILFNRENFPDFSVAKAIAASIAVPGVFEPVNVSLTRPAAASVSQIEKKISLLDGGMVSNLPVWALEEYRISDPDLITIAFVIEDVNSSVDSLTEFMKCLVRAAIFGGQELSHHNLDNIYNVLLPAVDLGVLDFDADIGRIKNTFWRGYDKAKYFIRMNLVIEEHLRTIHRSLKDSVEYHAPGSLVQLRSAVAVPVSDSFLKVRFHENLGADPLRRAHLPIESTIAGYAYTDRDIVFWDKAAASVVRRGKKMSCGTLAPPFTDTIAAAVCVPIFPDIDAVAVHPDLRPAPAAILCLDSDQQFWVSPIDTKYQTTLLLLSAALSPLLRGLSPRRRYNGFD